MWRRTLVRCSLAVALVSGPVVAEGATPVREPRPAALAQAAVGSDSDSLGVWAAVAAIAALAASRPSGGRGRR